jgi:hypothetical protein
MLLLATQGRAADARARHPNLGRLLQPPPLSAPRGDSEIWSAVVGPREKSRGSYVRYCEPRSGVDESTSGRPPTPGSRCTNRLSTDEVIDHRDRHDER